jgi:hypothetical protein
MKTTIIDGKIYEVCKIRGAKELKLKELSELKLKYDKNEGRVFTNGTKGELIKKCLKEGYEPLWFSNEYYDNLLDINYDHIGCVFGGKKK